VKSVEKKGKFIVALTGGSSPAKLYRLLAHSPYKENLSWDKTHVFWGDERWVSTTDDSSNAKMSFEALLNHVPIPLDQIHVMYANEEPNGFAGKYEEQIRKQFGNEEPRFDLILLGMGDDGHTASLFPGTPVLHEQHRLVQAYYLSPQSMFRVTLTAPCINAAKKIVFLVFGEKKADALREVLEGEYNPDKYPAQLIQPTDGQVIWLTDEFAATKLTTSRN
jgi:6-phosphogluconolactonase